MLRVLNALFDDRFGGPQKRVLEVAEKLKGADMETILLLPEGNGNTSEIAVVKGIDIVRIPFRKMPKPKQITRVLRWLMALPKDVYLISKVIRDKQVDIVHVNGAFFMAPALAAKWTRRRLVWHLNDTIVSPGFARVLGRLVRCLADQVVVAAEAVARHYYMEAHDYRVIYAPVDVVNICKKEYGVNGNITKRVGLVGNWNPLKGLEVFIDAAVCIVNRCDYLVKFAIAGSKLDSHTEYADAIEKQISEGGLQDKIDCNGFVDDIPAFLREQDVLVLASWSEACPMAVLEGMAAGIPVVATDVGGARELLHPEQDDAAGFVVEAGDAVQMAAYVDELLADERLREKMGAFGRQAAEQRFSLEVCVASHVNLYKSLYLGE